MSKVDTDVVNITQGQVRFLMDKIKQGGGVINGGTVAPTASTVGAVGQIYSYVNNGTPKMAMCTDISGGNYTWTTII